MIPEPYSMHILIHTQNNWPGIDTLCNQVRLNHRLSFRLTFGIDPTDAFQTGNHTLPILITDQVSAALAARSQSIPCVGLTPSEQLLSIFFPCDLLTDSPGELTCGQLAGLACHKAGLPVIIGRSKRLVFRELAKTDASVIQTLYTPRAARYLDRPETCIFTNEAKLNAYVREIYPFYGYGLYGVLEQKSPGQFIGCMGFYDETVSLPDFTLSHGVHSAPISGTFVSYFLSERKWGQGFADEGLRFLVQYAFNALQKETLFALIDSGNTASLRLAKRLSFQLYQKNIRYHCRFCHLYILRKESCSWLPPNIENGP